MQLSTLDPTAGETVRAIRPANRRVTDPTDPRHGRPPMPSREHPLGAPRIVDPTDPECGRRSV